MKLMTKRQISTVAQDVAKLQIMLLNKRHEISDEMAEDLTRGLRQIVEKTGGEYGIGKFSDQIACHFLGSNKRGKQKEKELAKVIEIC